jgi:hypothetical protein
MHTIQVTVLLTGLAFAPLLAAGPVSANGEGGAKGEFRASLTGAQEVTDPPGGVDTEARGRGTLGFDRGLTEAEVELSVADLVDVQGAHIHCGGAGENGPIIVDFGVILAGAVDGEIVETTLGNADIAVADCVPLLGFPVNNIASLKRAADAGLLYMNVHTAAFPDGEIRGQLLGP